MLIINGIFKQLCHLGESTSQNVLQDLLTTVHSLTEKENSYSTSKQSGNSKSNIFDQLPDSLMCHIATYLQTREIFTKWNCINHRFIQIGLKPGSLHVWDMRDRNVERLDDYREYENFSKFIQFTYNFL